MDLSGKETSVELVNISLSTNLANQIILPQSPPFPRAKAPPVIGGHGGKCSCSFQMKRVWFESGSSKRCGASIKKKLVFQIFRSTARVLEKVLTNLIKKIL